MDDGNEAMAEGRTQWPVRPPRQKIQNIPSPAHGSSPAPGEQRPPPGCTCPISALGGVCLGVIPLGSHPSLWSPTSCVCVPSDPPLHVHLPSLPPSAPVCPCLALPECPPRPERTCVLGSGLASAAAFVSDSLNFMAGPCPGGRAGVRLVLTKVVTYGSGSPAVGRGSARGSVWVSGGSDPAAPVTPSSEDGNSPVFHHFSSCAHFCFPQNTHAIDASLSFLLLKWHFSLELPVYSLL